ncbi:hypothetical protein KZO96_09880 [Bifidobacterium pseudocatenulatum]|uniref:hypothetical protein n=1 Tax=Bifidobacterium pseudocatenulatum TaxID=28026 RepID=UPI001CFE603D|nr:hypothetical protein [Bifidobacterium pseudocatenulatum]MCB4888147.1 hypothetical protein [Bifidobacterium pseudocatenulatum]MCB4898653.1 hypothetical protein [Bifidobacterium pseudocatenulatum]
MTSHVTRATAMLVAAASLSAGLSAPAMADETATPAMADNGTTQPAPSKPRETLQKAVEQAGKVDRTRNWKDQDALTTFVSALTTAQAKLADQTTADADLTAAETALTAAQERLVKAGTVEQDARAQKLPELEAYTGDNAKYYPHAIGELNKSITNLKDATDDKMGDQTIESEIGKLDDLIASLKKDNTAFNRLTAAKKAADKELGRNLSYKDSDVKQTLQKAVNDVDATLLNDADQTLATNQKRDSTAETIERALGNMKDKGDETVAYRNALKAAQDKQKIQQKDGKAYTSESYKPLDDLLKADFNADDADRDALSERTEKLNQAVEGLIVASWSIDGKTLSNADGTLTATLDRKTAALEHPTLTGSDGSTIGLTDTAEPFTQENDQLGVGHITHTLSGTTADAAKTAIRVTYDVASGTETTVTLDDGSKTGAAGKFTRNEDGSWTANLTGMLGKDLDATAATSTTFRLSDGTTLDGTLGDAVTTTPNGTTLLTRTLTADGKDSHGTPVKAVATLSYTYDPRISLTLTHKSGTAENSQTVAVDGLTADMDVNTLGSVYSAGVQERGLTGDQWELNVKHGANVSNPTIAVTTSGEGSRILVATIRYQRLDADGHTLVNDSKIVRVNVPFAAAPKVIGNDKAALAGIKVNGQDIPGFSADKVDYTITAGKDERVKVSPVARDGQTVVAGDSRQTAFTTVQTWTVSKDGESRTYTVTLVRDHTEKTADEKFTPAEPAGQVSKAENPSDDNTALESVGYMLDGAYHKSDSDEFTIPEGGLLSWSSYAGQVVQPTVERDHGMTFRYELGVLSKDGTKYATRVLTVTYLTADTHRAELTGIKVDRRDVAGFDPKTMEYDVRVDNPERYVVTPSFDKMTGMSLTVHKTASQAVIKVTSADGLTQATYTLDVSKATLADTGTGVGLGSLIFLLAAGAVGSLLSRRRGTAEM